MQDFNQIGSPFYAGCSRKNSFFPYPANSTALAGGSSSKGQLVFLMGRAFDELLFETPLILSITGSDLRRRMFGRQSQHQRREHGHRWRNGAGGGGTGSAPSPGNFLFTGDVDGLMMNFPRAITPDGHFTYRVAMTDPNCVVHCRLAVETMSVSATTINHVGTKVHTGSAKTMTGIDKKTFQMVTSPYSP